MKKTLLFILLSASTALMSQNCKYKINEVDEFTKSTILETKGGILTMSGMGFGFSTAYSMKKINDIKYLNLHISSPSIFTLREDAEIMFKTNTDHTINFKFPKTLISNYIPGSRIGTSTTPSMYAGSILIPISDDNYERLLAEQILKLRIYMSDGYVDNDIKAKRAKSFQEDLKCIE